jgi:hypothetical protein
MRDFGVFIPILALMIPVIALLLKPFREWMKMKERQMELATRDTAERAAQYGAHIERLEQRVRVLERIVTDKGTVVADQIEALRESPRLDKPLN